MFTVTVPVPQQLSFDVGTAGASRPAGASVGITGKAALRRQMYLGDNVLVQLVATDGEIIASFDGEVVDVGFKQHDATETTVEWVERVHKIKIADREG